MHSRPSQDGIPLPVHVAIIMDGNGRWAEERHRPRLFGHKAGVDSVRAVVEAARETGIKHLTLYAFSTENWKRPSVEVSGLMGLLKTYLKAELDNMLQNDIRLGCIGQLEKLPRDVGKILQDVIEKTSQCSGMRLNLALSYGGRSEIIHAVRKLTKDCVHGLLKPEDICEQHLSDALYTSGQPDPDLLIRTGGERRLSNFLLWQASYAELYFTDVKWPDFDKQQFQQAIEYFIGRQRRFGKTGAQLRGK